MQKKQQKGSESSYDSILSAVVRLAKTVAYEKMTVRQICKEAGVSTGTFYHFFPGKAELISAHLNTGHQERADNIERLVQQGSAIEKLHVFVKEYAQMNLEAGVEELKSLLSPTENLQHNRQPMFDVLKKIIADGQKNGTFVKSAPAVEMTDIAMTYLRGCAYCWCVKEGAFDLGARMQLIVNILTHAFVDVLSFPIDDRGMII